ncbi:DUF2790 domain-containing protein [Pseudomonas sp. LRF_L74]|uniref:DUF2790 domain-containing protein n=1 Tax=Pseudomonas sp. LRF_L74 TaxID=3369422 RepID=UPI003F5D663F
MKALVLLALAGLSPLAFAQDNGQTSPDSQLPVEQYHYGMKLDIDHVVSLTDSSTTCGLMTSYMVYEDHQGNLHRLAYLIQGNGCSNS